MPDRTLHGNGKDCPACALRRESAKNLQRLARISGGCNNCDGTGRIALPIEEIIAAHVAWARAHHWPEFERRIAR